MKIEDRMLIKNLAQTAQIVNTINGGMVEPSTIIEEVEYGLLMTMKVPAVSIENIKIEIKDDSLFVFQNLAESSDMELPLMLGMLQLTKKIDLELIHAEYESDSIKIHLPYDELTNGFEKEIEIFRK